MAKIKSEFEELEKELKRGLDPRKTKRLNRQAVDWFIDKVSNQRAWRGKSKDWDPNKKRKEFGPSDYTLGKQGIKGAPIIGQCFVYWYDAKHKDTLKYWDRFPIVIPIEMYEDGWLGLNLHYLPPFIRARLLGLIMGTMNSPKLSREAKARITYALIKSTSKFSIAGPCVKRYLAGHVRSRIIRVHPQEWENVVMLPMEAFASHTQAVTNETVWRDSLEEIKRKGRGS